MYSRSATTDHRWGRRIDVNAPVELHGSVGMLGDGVLRNVSASGALIRTSAIVAPPAPIRVRPQGSAQGFDARVVRRNWGAIGVGWLHPDRFALCRLLARHDLPVEPESRDADSLEVPPGAGVRLLPSRQ